MPLLLADFIRQSLHTILRIILDITLILNGNPEEYLKNVTDYSSLDK